MEAATLLASSVQAPLPALACARTRRSAAALRMCAAGTGLRADGTARLAAHAARELTCGVLALDAKGLNQANPPHLVQCGGGASTGGDDTTVGFCFASLKTTTRR